MKKYRFLFVLFLLFIIKSKLICAELLDEEEQELKEFYSNRYDDFESPTYKKKWKSDIESKNKENIKIKVIKQSFDEDDDYEDKIKVIKKSYKTKKRNLAGNKPWKAGEYTGIYKIGNPYEVFGKKYYPREQPDYVEVGMASWYGEEFHNGKTANGEIYNMNDYTAAHTTLPLPSVVRITNLENGKSINVRVNDRGPFKKGRIIDVSKKVAKKLDFHNQGLTKVKVEYLKDYTEEMLEDYGLK